MSWGPQGAPGVCGKDRVVENCALGLWVWSHCQGVPSALTCSTPCEGGNRCYVYISISPSPTRVTPSPRWDSDSLTLGTKTGKPPSELNYAICFYHDDDSWYMPKAILGAYFFQAGEILLLFTWNQNCRRVFSICFSSQQAFQVFLVGKLLGL